MADIELVIKIPEDVYKEIMAHDRERRESGKSAYYFEGLIQNGTPLPKGCDIQRIIPKRVDVQKWIYTECPNPNCNYELSTHNGDGYYFIEHEPKFCPNCGQALLWESEDKE